MTHADRISGFHRTGASGGRSAGCRRGRGTMPIRLGRSHDRPAAPRRRLRPVKLFARPLGGPPATLVPGRWRSPWAFCFWAGAPAAPWRFWPRAASVPSRAILRHPGRPWSAALVRRRACALTFAVNLWKHRRGKDRSSWARSGACGFVAGPGPIGRGSVHHRSSYPDRGAACGHGLLGAALALFRPAAAPTGVGCRNLLRVWGLQLSWPWPLLWFILGPWKRPCMASMMRHRTHSRPLLRLARP